MTPKPQANKTTNERYLKIQVRLAPKTNGKKFSRWCEEWGFTPLNAGRRAWSSSLSTYLRDADGVAFSNGEMFLYYEEDAVDMEALITEARINEHKVFWEIVPSDAEHVETLKDISNYRLIKLRAELND